METSECNSTYKNSSASHCKLKHHPAAVVYISIILSIEIPLICAAIYVVFFLTKSGQSAPVFVINLLITDLIQIVSASPVFILDNNQLYFILPLLLAYFTGMYFMTCVAVERYLLIAHPIWYRSQRKPLMSTSLIGWFVSFIFAITWFYTDYLLVIVPFIYFIVIILCFAGACRALSHSQSVTSIKRRLVLASLFFVLLSYTFTVLPLCTAFLFSSVDIDEHASGLFKYAPILNTLNPIADCVLYVFMRNDAENAFSTPQCCPRRRIRNEIPLTTVTGVQSGKAREI